jgi:hypothetical protein
MSPAPRRSPKAPEQVGAAATIPAAKTPRKLRREITAELEFVIQIACPIQYSTVFVDSFVCASSQKRNEAMAHLGSKPNKDLPDIMAA